jgi:hypothetical protein
MGMQRVGAIEIPDNDKVPQTEILIKMRKGVALCYSAVRDLKLW